MDEELQGRGRDALDFMLRQLTERVGPCPPDCAEAWVRAGGGGLSPAPVWVWLQRHGAAQPCWVPQSLRAGLRHLVLEAELQEDCLLASQYMPWQMALNGMAVPLSEEEEEELCALMASNPEEYAERKLQTWRNIFDVGWQGEPFNLQNPEHASVQAASWQLPMDAVLSAKRQVSLGTSENFGLDAIQVCYDNRPLGEDVVLSGHWRERHCGRTLELTVVELRGGHAKAAGVGLGWRLTCILNDMDSLDPLPRLPVLDERTETFAQGSASGVPVAAEALVADLSGLAAVVVVFEPPAGGSAATSEASDAGGGDARRGTSGGGDE